MGRTDLLRLNECAQYLIDSERDDFYEYVFNGEDPINHVFSVAYIALHGESDFETLVKNLKESQNGI
jgi:hypothetical protein